MKLTNKFALALATTVAITSCGGGEEESGARALLPNSPGDSRPPNNDIAPGMITAFSQVDIPIKLTETQMADLQKTSGVENPHNKFVFVVGRVGIDDSDEGCSIVNVYIQWPGMSEWKRINSFKKHGAKSFSGATSFFLPPHGRIRVLRDSQLESCKSGTLNLGGVAGDEGPTDQSSSDVYDWAMFPLSTATTPAAGNP